jgi:hypothetical protein
MNSIVVAKSRSCKLPVVEAVPAGRIATTAKRSARRIRVTTINQQVNRHGERPGADSL